MGLRRPVIYDLCGGSGSWALPWLEADYEVRRIEIKEGLDVRLLKIPSDPVYGVLAAPPCTHLCIAGAESWKRKGDGPLLEALEIVSACIRFAIFSRAEFWSLENPPGRLRKYLGPPQMVFQPRTIALPFPAAGRPRYIYSQRDRTEVTDGITQTCYL